MPASFQGFLMTLGVLLLGGGAIFWYWSRIRGGRGGSANDYVEISKAQAQAQLKDIIRRESRGDSS